ncbi:MAG TPA: transcriptional regulator [Blastocatellia bacterium]|nr:transcriptional regulator [Blastocatellia bacterium]HMX25714.1 transcriptional regulator [Blastocatellia bacterium]HMY70512.1 transcriptional regulator [Blastocatellia bacterium]HMZ20754.1 transcriptional regulator [Blastocatellia bacterium]HNG30555.1 transcriptional regulator [Blastocatellia bacterium]
MNAIENEDEYERALAIVEPMMSREDTLSPEEVKLFDLLVKLIQDYEEEHHPIEPAAPHQVLRHLMEARGLSEHEIAHLFESNENASDAVNGVRAISKPQAEKLAQFFHVSPDLFI